jgi:hypothetical protein
VKDITLNSAAAHRLAKDYLRVCADLVGADYDEVNEEWVERLLDSLNATVYAEHWPYDEERA